MASCFRHHYETGREDGALSVRSSLVMFPAKSAPTCIRRLSEHGKSIRTEPHVAAGCANQLLKSFNNPGTSKRWVGGAMSGRSSRNNSGSATSRPRPKSISSTNSESAAGMVPSQRRRRLLRLRSIIWHDRRIRFGRYASPLPGVA
jgi:hypothetical protein